VKRLPVECVVRGYLAGFGLGGIPEKRDGFRDTAAEEHAGKPRTAVAVVHSHHQSGFRPRHADDRRGNGGVNRHRAGE